MELFNNSSLNFAPVTVDYAKAVARKMFGCYDRDNNDVIESHEIYSMYQDAYRSISTLKSPTTSEVTGYGKVLDGNKDGRVTLPDMEALCIKVLVGEDAYRVYNELRKSEEAKKTSSSVYQGSVTASPGSYKLEEYVKPAGYSYEEPAKKSASPFAAGDYKPYTSPSSEGRYGEIMNRSQALTNDNSRFFASESGESLRRSAFPSPKGFDLGIGPVYTGANLAKSGVYVQKKSLDQIRRVFERYDVDKDGLIDYSELKKMVEETYWNVGINRVISDQHVQSYMRFADVNNDGRISFPEFEEIVLKGFARHNIKFE